MKTIFFSALLSIVLFTSCKNEKSVDISAEISAIENGLELAIQIKGETPKHYNLSDRMMYHKIPGVSIAVVKDGKIRWAKGYGVANTINGKAVDVNTIFQAGSTSKAIASLSALQLAEEGFIDLDQDIDPYLTDWKIPDNEYTKDEKVTLRRLLTHTAGMTVSGFPGYQQTDTCPSNITILNGKGNTPAIYVDTIPGSIWRYSGGGYTVMEELVEDISGLPFEKYMHKNILQPMGMTNSTYEQPLPPDRHSSASAAYDNQGEIIDGLWHNYPEQAAAGLWTTPTDLAKYCIEVQGIFSGKSTGILSRETVEMMLTKHKNDWGLGLSLKFDGDSLIFDHGVKNAGFTTSMMSFAHRGDAVIILTNADNGARLIKEILLSISNYYVWVMIIPRIIEPIELTPEKLNHLVGKFKYINQVPGIGDYIVEVKIEEGRLIIIDTIKSETLNLTPLEELKFIDIQKRDEILFQYDESNSLSFQSKNRKFRRIE